MNCAAAVLAAAAVVLCLRVASGRAQLLGQQPCDAQDVVIGLSVGPTLMEQSAADGFRAAIAEASRITRLGLRLVEYNHSNEDMLVANVERLVVNDSALLVVGRPGNTTTEKNVLELLKRHRVPLVGFVSGSESLRDLKNITAQFSVGATSTVSLKRKETIVDLPLVVNVRGSVRDELNNVVSVLLRDWATISAVALVADNTPLGEVATGYTNTALAVFNGRGLLSNYTFGRNVLDADLQRAEDVLFHSSGQRAPAAVIVCTESKTTIRFVQRLAHCAHTGVRLFLMSWTSAMDLTTALHADNETRGLLAAKNISLYFTQTMPFPTPPADKLDQAIPLLQQFSLVPLAHKPHSALEGYLTGWFIYDVAQKAVARHGLPLKPGEFLYSVFVDTRTFSVLGVTLGPYGDGGISGPRSMQSSGDACNQGVHEVFMTKIDLATCLEAPLPGASLKFAGCHTQMLENRSSVTSVGSILRPGNADDMVARSGLLGAVQDYGSQSAKAVLLRSVTGSVEKTLEQLNESGTVVVVGPTLASKELAERLNAYAVLSPMPGLWALRRPLDMMIHLFPSSYDEVQTAFEFFHLKDIEDYAVVINGASAFSTECIDRFKVLTKNITDGHVVLESEEKNATKYILEEGRGHAGYFILGGAFDPHSVEGTNATIVLNSQVRAIRTFPNSRAWTTTYRLSVAPPSTLFATTSSLRSDYDAWVSSEDTDENSFASFFVGKFLTQVINHAAKDTMQDYLLTADDIVEAVYDKGSFTIEGIEIGPFSDECKDTYFCCNQGLNTVYVLQGAYSNNIVWHNDQGNCGRRYLTKTITTAPRARASYALEIALGAGCGSAFVLCIIVAAVAVWMQRRVEFFNIRRGELELGNCIGHGRVGSMYLADWHGTPVAVRLIDKKATPKEDQRLIKEEVLLLHKHHHPNLLMLMGYCETKTELLVVTEYMEGGTVSDFLARGKPFVQVFTLISMAFDVLKGIAYLHSCKPAIVHGSICSHNLLIDSQGTVKVSDLWYSNKRGAFSSSGSSSKALSRVGWQPPEVIAQAPLTPAADVYAFGIVLWELIAPTDLTIISVGGGAGESMSPEVVELLESCWQMQPERRPSVFQILRHWSTTFGSLGKFEIPQDFEVPMGEELHTRQPSQVAINNINDRKMGNGDGELIDEIEATMASFMPVNEDSDALQTPQASGAELYAITHYAATHGLPPQQSPLSPEQVTTEAASTVV
eukprot:m51a1_g8820 putative pas domain-containing protein tyrosine kinase (1220) ;mRNA; f:331062-335613